MSKVKKLGQWRGRELTFVWHLLGAISKVTITSLVYSFQQSCKVHDVVVYILEIWKQRLGAIQSLSHRYFVNKW
jgi:hypothetical protein